MTHGFRRSLCNVPSAFPMRLWESEGLILSAQLISALTQFEVPVS